MKLLEKTRVLFNYKNTINIAKLYGKAEDEIYKQFFDGKSIEVENFGDTVSNIVIEARIKYLTKLTEDYLSKW